MGIRGNGLGLTWTESQPMTLVEAGLWSFRIEFISDWSGFQCMNCSDESLGTENFFMFKKNSK
jgi:hypothetical protein